MCADRPLHLPSRTSSAVILYLLLQRDQVSEHASYFTYTRTVTPSISTRHMSARTSKRSSLTPRPEAGSPPGEPGEEKSSRVTSTRYVKASSFVFF